MTHRLAYFAPHYFAPRWTPGRMFQGAFVWDVLQLLLNVTCTSSSSVAHGAGYRRSLLSGLLDRYWDWGILFGQCDVVWSDTFSLAPSASRTVTLQGSLTDAWSESVDMEKLRLLLVSGSDIEVTPAPTNGFSETMVPGASPKHSVDGTLLITGEYAVSSTSKSIVVTNVGASTAAVTLIVAGSKS